jgi:hypothetical protein
MLTPPPSPLQQQQRRPLQKSFLKKFQKNSNIIILSSWANQWGAYSFVEMADACSLPPPSEFSPVEPESQQESLSRTLMEGIELRENQVGIFVTSHQKQQL